MPRSVSLSFELLQTFVSLIRHEGEAAVVMRELELNQPTLSPFVYPTRASNYSALKFQSTPPQWDKAIMWIDQN